MDLRENMQFGKYVLIVVLAATLLQLPLVSSRDEYTDTGWFYRNNMDISAVPDDIPHEAVGVYLNNNNFTKLKAASFSNLSQVTFMSLADNKISGIEVGTFEGLTSLVEIWLGGNRLTKLKANIFNGLSSLEKLTLSNNLINETEHGAFNGLSNVNKLYLYGNNLTTLRAYMFIGLHSLRLLVLTYNHISVIEVGAFIGLGDLKELWMDHNNEKLKDMKNSTFVGLGSLEILYIHGNRIKSVEAGLFNGLFSLVEIGLDDNEISEVKAGSFQGLESLSKLWLFNNSLHTLPSSTFTGLPRPLDLTLGGNPLECDTRLCWIKRGEEEGWIRWIQLVGRPLKPRCLDGQDWDNITLNCPTEVECGDPGGLPHGVRSESVWPYTVGTQISYTCHPCYTGGGTITCEHIGRWTTRPQCQAVKCRDPGNIDNAQKVPDVAPLDYYACGKHVTYICNHGYKLHGNASLFCQPDGKFNGSLPECVRVSANIEIGEPKVAASSSNQEHKFKAFVYLQWVLIAFGVICFLVGVLGVTYWILRRKGIRIFYKDPRLASPPYADVGPSGGPVGGAVAAGAMGAAGATAVGVTVDGQGSAYFNKVAALESELNGDPDYNDIPEKGDFAEESAQAYEQPAEGRRRSSAVSGGMTPGGGGGASPGVVSVYPAGESPFRLPVYDEARESPPEYTRHPSVDENMY